MEPLSLEVLKSCGDVALRDEAQWTWWGGLGLDDLRGLFPSE